MQDPRDVFCDDLDIGRSRIKTSISPIVLFCGGQASEPPPPKSDEPKRKPPKPKIKSLRHAVVLEHRERNTHSPSFELYMPEQIQNWHDGAIFKNLVQFEEQLAAICAIVVVIIESPGSIAELGAFSQQHELQKKLMVFKSSDFKEPSFIELGILKDIKESGNSIFSSPVKGFPWEVNYTHTIEREITVDVLTTIEEGLTSVNKTEAISDVSSSHTTTIIRELIKLFVALKASEISTYLDKLNIFVPQEQLNQKLFLLRKFNLIKLVEYDSTYYCSIEDGHYNTLRLSTKQGKHLSATTIMIDCTAFYNNKNDRRRIGAIKSFRRGGGK